MTIREPRVFEVISEGSDRAEAFCTDVLEPAADHFAGENFQDSELERIGNERSFFFPGDCTAYVEFDAFKTSYNEDEDRWNVNFVLTCVLRRPKLPDEYWPEQGAEQEDGDAEIWGPVVEDDDDEIG